MEAAQTPAMGDNRWRRDAEDFAVHIVVDDVRGFFSRDLIIEPGTQAILLADGASLGIVGPGRYTLDDLAERSEVFLRLRSAHRMEAILIDTADTELAFTVADLMTQDPLKVEASVSVTVVVDNPMRFFQTLMRAQRSFSVHQLRSYLYAEVEDAAQEWVRRYSVKDLNTNLTVKQDLEQDIEMHLQRTSERNGLAFVRVRALDLTHPYMDRVTGVQAEAFVANEEAQAQFDAERQRLNQERVARGLATEAEIGEKEDALAKRKSLFEIADADERQDLFEFTRKVEHRQERVELWEQMRQAVLSDKMAELRSEEELEVFLREQDERQLLRDREWEALQQTIREEQEDHQTQRAHLLAKLQMERDYELRQIELLQRSDLEEAELDFKLKQARRELEGNQDLERRRWAFELEKRQREAEIERQQRKVAEMDRRERELENTLNQLEIERRRAETQAEIARIEREEDRADFELGALALERMKEIRRRDEMERDFHKVEMEARRLEIQLQAEESRRRMQMEHERQQQEFQLRQEAQSQAHEIERIETLSEASAEVVISMAGAEQARIIGDLKQTEALKGLSDSQVESLMATRSPQFARALEERWKAIEAGKATEAQEAMYERMLQQQAEADRRVEAALRDSLQQQTEAAQREQETAFEAMRSVQQTAESFAQSSGQQQPTVIVTPGAGRSGVASVGGGAIDGVTSTYDGGRVVVCPNCHSESPVGTKFCQNCGHQFFGGGE
jgi:membrane protease subunit (stomatin/prohibitin family)